MRWRTIVIGLLMVELCTVMRALPGDQCKFKAYRTLDAASDRILAHKIEAARALLEQADTECSISAEVRARIGNLYFRIGDVTLASLYGRNSTLNPLAETPAGPSNSTSGPTNRGSTPTGFVHQKYALVVGISRFASDKIPPLRFSDKDARDFAAVLTDPKVGRFLPENVTVLTNENATTDQIRRALGKIAVVARPDDLVVLYFSTHGSDPKMERAKAVSGYLVTYDTDVNNLYGTAFGMDALALFMLDKLTSDRVITFLDTCFSGDVVKHAAGSKALVDESATLSQDAITQVAQGEGRVVITSSSNTELSWESESNQNSFFTYYLMTALRGQSNSPKSIRQLFDEVSRNLSSEVKKQTQHEQHPTIFPLTNVPEIYMSAASK